MEPSEDEEEAVRIAHGLTHDEWGNLWWIVKRHQDYDPWHDDSLIAQGVAILVTKQYKEVCITSLGRQVWEWRWLFCSPTTLAGWGM
jgi:hypothetical protein